MITVLHMTSLLTFVLFGYYLVDGQQATAAHFVTLTIATLALAEAFEARRELAQLRGARVR